MSLRRIKRGLTIKTCFKKRCLIYIFICIFVCLFTYDVFISSGRLIKAVTNCYFKNWSKDLRPESVGLIGNVCEYRDSPVFDYEKCIMRRTLFLKQKGSKWPEEQANFRCSHLMSFSGRPSGRLGNMMFQVASVIGLATWHYYTPVFNENFRLFNAFELMNRINFTVNNTGRAGERVCCEHSKKLYQLDHSKNWTLSGYLQSWKYFHDARDVVKKAFTFKHKYKTEASDFLKSVRREGFINVCIHVRRGDFESKRNVKLGYVVAPLSYIQRAMQYFRHKFREVTFIFVSDAIKWCNKTFQNDNYHFSPFKDPVLDMALIVSCDNVIVSTGTFGWMGAWLAGGITIYCAGFPKRGSWFEKQFNKDGNFSDYYPNDWIGMY